MPDSTPTFTLASLKPKAGNSTAALALAWAWGNQGSRALVVPNWRIVPNMPAPKRIFDNVYIGTGREGEAQQVRADVVILDGKPLQHADSREALRGATAMIINLPPTALSRRSLPRFLSDLKRDLGPDTPPLVSLLPSFFEADNPVQVTALEQLHYDHKGAIVPAAVPRHDEVCNWKGTNGNDLPEVARESFTQLAARLNGWLQARICTSPVDKPAAALPAASQALRNESHNPRQASSTETPAS